VLRRWFGRGLREARVIEPSDCIVLAPGVTVDAGALVDDVRGARVPANAAAALVLAHAQGGGTVAELGDVLARAGALDGLGDARAFCVDLNRGLFLNVRVPRLAMLRRRLAAARVGLVLRAPSRRVDGRSLVRVAGALAPGGVVLTLLTLPLALLAGSWTIALAVGAGVVLHELAHAAALRGLPRALVLNGLRPSILHPRLGPRRAVVVASAGPLAPALGALVLAVVARSPACAPLAAHALGLTVLAPDGRHACGLS
jgi:hypothetical protein